MENDVAKMLSDLKAKGVAVSKVESDLGFSNGLLGKAAKGICSLSADKYSKLWNYHGSETGKSNKALKLGSQIPEKPIIDAECRQLKDYCKEVGLSSEELMDFHRKSVASTKKKTVSQEREEKRSNTSNTNSRNDIRLKKLGF